MHSVLLERPEGKKSLGNPGVGGKIILRGIFKNCKVGDELD
jgi:hypothetical protein